MTKNSFLAEVSFNIEDKGQLNYKTLQIKKKIDVSFYYITTFILYLTKSIAVNPETIYFG